MVSPGRPYWLVPQESRLVNWTNWSIAPPLYAFCSAVYPWSWSQVTACIGESRAGCTALGLFGARRPPVAKVLMSLGVFFAAVKAAVAVPVPCWVSPGALAAFG